MIIEVVELNELLSQGFSFRQICQTKNIKRSTLQGQLKKAGYVLHEGQYVPYSFIDHEDVFENGDIVAICDKDGNNNFDFHKEGGCTDVGTKNEPTNLDTLDKRIEMIKVRLGNITWGFCTVAFDLYRINRDKEYEVKGYSTIVDFAQSEFNLNRNNTYNFLRIADQFFDINGNYYTLKDTYKDYNFSQLVEVLSLPDEVRKEVTSDMSVKEIREKKKQVKENKKEDISEPISGQQTFIEANFQQLPEVNQDNNQSESVDYKKEYEALKEVFEKRSTRLRDKEKELIELRAKLGSSNEVKSKVDLSLSISVLEIAWSNEADDNKANELRKQIDYIRSL